MKTRRAESVTLCVARAILSGGPITAEAMGCSRHRLAEVARRVGLRRVDPCARPSYYILGLGCDTWARVTVRMRDWRTSVAGQRALSRRRRQKLAQVKQQNMARVQRETA